MGDHLKMALEENGRLREALIALWNLYLDEAGGPGTNAVHEQVKAVLGQTRQDAAEQHVADVMMARKEWDAPKQSEPESGE